MFKIISLNFLKIFLIILLSSLDLSAESQIEELNPGFNYSEWYQSESGYTANTQWFGAWVIAPRNDELYLGFATARPAESDGAMLAKWVTEWLIPLGKFNEQGVHSIKWVADTLYGIGSDPSIGDGWDGGNFYKYYPQTGEFKKLRYDSEKNPILPEVLHSWGMDFDITTKTFYLATSSYDPVQYSKNGSDCGSPDDSSLACFGQVWQSKDYGCSWELLSGKNPYEISPYRTMDVINFNEQLFAINYNNYYPGDLKRSTDNGMTWELISDIVPSSLYRMCVFQNKLIVADYDVSSLYIIDENNLIRLSFLPARLNYSFNTFTNVDDRFLVSFFVDGSVHYTTDLISWDVLVPATGRNFLSIAYWENDKSIVLAERGDTGKIWKIDITELLNTGIEFDSETEITIYSDNNYITINSNNNKILAIDILNVLGKGIPLHFSTNSKEIRYCISQLTPGLYFVRCRNQNNLFIKKFIKY